MAQIRSTDREALEKEGSQMAVCYHHRYLLHCSLLRSGELGGRTVPRPIKSLAARSLLPPSIFQRVLRSCQSMDCTPDFALQKDSEPGGSGRYPARIYCLHGLNTYHTAGQVMLPAFP